MAERIAPKGVGKYLQVKGLKVAAFGPFDLSVAMGYDGLRTPEVEELLMRGVRAALTHGVRPVSRVAFRLSTVLDNSFHSRC